MGGDEFASVECHIFQGQFRNRIRPEDEETLNRNMECPIDQLGKKRVVRVVGEDRIDTARQIESTRGRVR